jgi:hypothetical protein
MEIDAMVEGLVSFAEHDWIGLWIICSDVEDELGVDDPEKNLEWTLIIVRELLKRGLIAGDSPQGSAVRFSAWRSQDPDLIAQYIRGEWVRRGGQPAWGDAPWLAHLRHCEPSHAA